MASLVFTKSWSSANNGEILSGQDLGTIQSDITTWANGNVGASNIAAGSVTNTMLANSAKVGLYAKDIFAGNTTGAVITGFTYSSASGLTATFLTGRAYVNVTSTDPDVWTEMDVSVAPTVLLTGSSDNYVDLKSDGTLANVPVASGAAEPGVTTDATRLALLVTSATTVTSSLDLRQLDPLYQIRNTVYTGSKNKIINGDFNIWQRGTSFASVSTEAYRSDRWLNRIAGGAVFTIRRGTDVPTATQSGHLSNYSMEIEVTTADASIAAGDQFTISQKIEGYNWAPLAQNVFSISFWVKSSVAGTYCVSVRNTGADRSLVKEYKIWQAGTWEKKVLSCVASPSAGSWDYINGVGVEVQFTMAAGSTFQTTADAWQTGNYVATSNQVNAVGTVGNFFRIAQVQVEAGSYASPFEKVDYAVELRKARRYYNEYGGEQAFQNFSTGWATGAENLETYFHYPEMRTAPAVSFSADTDFRVSHEATAASAVDMTANEITRRSMNLTATVAAVLTAGNGGGIDADNTTDARIKLDSEL